MSEENRFYRVVFNDGRELYTKGITEVEKRDDVHKIYILYIYTKEEEEERNKEQADSIELIKLIAETRDETIKSQEEAVMAVARLSQALMQAAPSERIRVYLLSFLPTVHKAYRSLGDTDNEKIAKEAILWLISFLPESERGKYASSL